MIHNCSASSANQNKKQFQRLSQKKKKTKTICNNDTQLWIVLVFLTQTLFVTLQQVGEFGLVQYGFKIPFKKSLGT